MDVCVWKGFWQRTRGEVDTLLCWGVSVRTPSVCSRLFLFLFFVVFVAALCAACDFVFHPYVLHSPFRPPSPLRTAVVAHPQGVYDMLHHGGGPKILPVIPQLIIPMKSACCGTCTHPLSPALTHAQTHAHTLMCT